MPSVLAKLQRELIVANTRDGLAAAWARDRRGGRPARLTPGQVELAQQLCDAGDETVQQIADIFAVRAHHGVRPPQHHLHKARSMMAGRRLAMRPSSDTCSRPFE